MDLRSREVEQKGRMKRKVRRSTFTGWHLAQEGEELISEERAMFYRPRPGGWHAGQCQERYHLHGNCTSYQKGLNDVQRTRSRRAEWAVPDFTSS